MSKFTPGPWRLTTITGSIGNAVGYRSAATFQDATSDVRYDGRLIAAAPDLYEALIEVEAADYLAQVRAALAKADGA